MWNAHEWRYLNNKILIKIVIIKICRFYSVVLVQCFKDFDLFARKIKIFVYKIIIKLKTTYT